MDSTDKKSELKGDAKEMQRQLNEDLEPLLEDLMHVFASHQPSIGIAIAAVTIASMHASYLATKHGLTPDDIKDIMCIGAAMYNGTKAQNVWNN